MKIFNLVSILGVALMLPVSCVKDEPKDDSGNGDQTPSVYEIVAPESEDFTVEVQESAEEGSEVPVKVTVTGEDLVVTSVKFNDSSCEFVSEDNLVYNYKFVMPSEDVEISVETSKTAFSISWENGSTYSISSSSSKAEPGDEVSVKVTVSDLKKRPASVSYGTAEELCEQVGDPYFDNDDASKGSLYVDYKFTMPEKDVKISVILEDNLNRIWRTSDENAAIRMRNRLYPDGWTPDVDETIDNEYDAIVCMGLFEDPAYFAIEPVAGYNYDTPSVKGQWTGRSYAAEYVYDAQYGGWCYKFAMPAEPVDITVTATEENIYDGKEFVGSYSGFWLKVREGSLIYQCAEPTLKYELVKNTTYTISSTDENNFSGTGFYSFNEETNVFEYQFDDMKGNVWTDDTNAGLGGHYGQDVSFVYVANVAEPMPDYTKYYVAAKDNAAISDFISASSTSGLTILTSFKLNGEQCYYWYDHSASSSLTKVDVEFLSGTSLADAGASALVKLDGQLFLKYAEEGGKPVFTTKGAEAGTYTGSNGDLVLDGFGNATFNGVTGTYELDGATLVFTDGSGVETEFLLDANDNSYSVISADSGEWNGPMHFSAVTENGVVNGKPKKALVELSLEGYVHFRLNFEYYGQWDSTDAINYAVSYVWDSAASTLTIAFVNIAGDFVAIDQCAGAYPSLSQIVFKVSDDKKSLEFTGVDAIYSTVNSNHLLTDGVVLTAVE